MLETFYLAATVIFQMNSEKEDLISFDLKYGNWPNVRRSWWKVILPNTKRQALSTILSMWKYLGKHFFSVLLLFLSLLG